MELGLDRLILLAVVGSALFLAIAVFLVFFVVFYQKRMLQKKMETQALESDYQRQLLQSTIESQEKERRRIASELHDGAGAMLSAAKLNLAMIGSGVIPKEEYAETVKDSKDMLDETIETIRRISKDLLPSSLEQFGLVKAIEELADKLSSSTTKVLFTRSIQSKNCLSKSQQLLVYRIVQELLNNALKHAEASKITISLKEENPYLVTVSDNGKGFDLEATKGDIKKGVGLYNIENRVSVLGGEVKFSSEKGVGTTIIIAFNS